jgi:hypothetical protein
MIAVGRYGDSEFPIYALSNAKGVAVRTGGSIIEMYEYERDDQNSHITTGYQLDDFDWSDYVTKIEQRMRQRIPEYMKVNPKMSARDIEDYIFNNKLGNNPKTNEPMLSEAATYNTEGESVVSKSQLPTNYVEILRSAYN